MNPGPRGPIENLGTITITTEPASPKSASAIIKVEVFLAPVFSISACQHFSRSASCFPTTPLMPETCSLKPGLRSKPLLLRCDGRFEHWADAFELCFELVQEFGGAG